MIDCAFENFSATARKRSCAALTFVGELLGMGIAVAICPSWTLMGFSFCVGACQHGTLDPALDDRVAEEVECLPQLRPSQTPGPIFDLVARHHGVPDVAGCGADRFLRRLKRSVAGIALSSLACAGRLSFAVACVQLVRRQVDDAHSSSSISSHRSSRGGAA